ncbi:MAG: hypothetical protein CVU08_08705 [Bacteroidetes bacterium HGW-Bacteroidetes-3]|jgi:hypothetical protein|nr:MAG: hypothetical protein CVU08_08705 [Bacteroidetes bacterium HGW-Bacteroidetes-3]
MKKAVFLTIALLFSFALSLESCGPVVVTSRIGTPPPPWFYPNRAEVVRYIYFPEHDIYYDFSLRTYLYLDNNIWISTNILPARFNHIDLRRSNRFRIHDYFGDDIKKYHNNNSHRSNLNRSNNSRRNPAINRRN